MSDLLQHLGRDTLPNSLVEDFVFWCIWEQGRPALLTILEKAYMTEVAGEIRATTDFQELAALGQKANDEAKELRGKTGPFGLSAAEAGTFEFTNMMKAASEDQWDAESVAFFASRVCGWAGWAATDFTDPSQKAAAEAAARREQETQLERLWRGMTSS